MNYVYVFCFTILFGYVAYLFIKDIRHGMIALVFVSLTGAMAFPYFMIPVRGFSTGLRLLLLLLPAAYVVFKSGFHPALVKASENRLFQIILLLLALTIGYLFISGMPPYGVYKLYLFLSRVFVPVCVLLVLAPFGKREIRVIFNTCILSSVLMAAYIVNWGELDMERAGAYRYAAYGIGSVFGAIEGGRLVGLGALISMGCIFLPGSASEPRMSFLKQAAIFALVPCLIFVMFSTGSRGPVVALVVAFVCGSIFAGRFRFGMAAVLIGALLVAGIIVETLTSESYYEKLLEYPGIARVVGEERTYRETVTENARWYLYDLAVSDFTSSRLIGKGTGAFSGGTVLGEGYEYPHNIFLEFAAELGLLGLGLFTIFLFFVFRTFWQIRQRVSGHRDVAIIFSCFIFTFVNALVSSDMSGNNMFWVFALFPSLLAFGLMNRRSPTIGQPMASEQISGKRKEEALVA